jgi:zona occludens toxin (predicted ATPase)
MNQSEEHGDETLTDDRMNIFNSKLLKIGAPVALAIAGMFIWNSMAAVNEMYSDDTSQETPGETSDMVIEHVQVERAKPEPDPRLLAILHDRNVEIVYNNGTYPYIDYIFELSSEDSAATFNLHQLRKMGFQIEAISQCLVLLINESAITRAMCRPDQTETFNDSEIAFASTTELVTSDG